MQNSRLIVGLACIGVAALLFLLGEGNPSTAGAVFFLILGIATIAISRRGKDRTG